MSSRPPGADAAAHTDESRTRQRAIAVAIALVVVALAYAPSMLDDWRRQWAVVATVATAFVLADAVAVLRRTFTTPGAIPLVLIAVLVGMALCVPETDQMRVAALVPVGLIGYEVVRRRVAALEWYAVAAGSVGWAGLLGASGRQSALVGATFAWWAVVLVPLVAVVRPIGSTRAAAAVAGVGAVAVIVVARTGGIASSGWPAAGAAAIAAATSFGIGLAISARRRSPTD